MIDSSIQVSGYVRCIRVMFGSGGKHGEQSEEYDRSEFLNEIDMIVQADPGSTAISDQLSSLKDGISMAIIMFIAMADEKLNATLDIKVLSLVRQ